MLKQISLYLILVAVEYAGVLIAVMLDLWSGVRKARRAGERCTSSGLRRTVGKLGAYYLALTGLTLVDAMAVTALLILRSGTGLSYPAFPFLTLLGALGLALIEVKSIYESSDRKADFTRAIEMLSDLASRVHFMQENKRF